MAGWVEKPLRVLTEGTKWEMAHKIQTYKRSKLDRKTTKPKEKIKSQKSTDTTPSWAFLYLRTTLPFTAICTPIGGLGRLWNNCIDCTIVWFAVCMSAAINLVQFLLCGSFSLVSHWIGVQQESRSAPSSARPKNKSTSCESSKEMSLNQ